MIRMTEAVNEQHFLVRINGEIIFSVVLLIPSHGLFFLSFSFHFQSTIKASSDFHFLLFLDSILNFALKIVFRNMKHLKIDRADTLQPEHVHITASGLEPGRAYRFDMK